MSRRYIFTGIVEYPNKLVSTCPITGHKRILQEFKGCRVGSVQTVELFFKGINSPLYHINTNHDVEVFAFVDSYKIF